MRMSRGSVPVITCISLFKNNMIRRKANNEVLAQRYENKAKNSQSYRGMLKYYREITDRAD